MPVTRCMIKRKIEKTLRRKLLRGEKSKNVSFFKNKREKRDFLINEKTFCLTKGQH